MRFLVFLYCLILTTGANTTSYAAAILLHQKDATVWLPSQLISGQVKDFKASEITVHQNDRTFTVKVDALGKFLINVDLQYTANKIWLTAMHNGKQVSSAILNLTLGYQPVAIVKPFAVIKGNKAVLQHKLINNAGEETLNYKWTADSGNPIETVVKTDNGETYVNIPQKDGVYYYTLTVSNKANTVKYKTYVQRKGSNLRAFEIAADNVTWLDSAIIYEITPNTFVKKGTFDDITKKLPEIKRLGINTIWLQPTYKTEHGGQGYDVIDYFNIRKDIGTEQQLANLIIKAKQLGLRVMFDFVPNHTSINHPYAVDCAKYGTNSHYYNFYQHKNDGVAYSSNYHVSEAGFVYYFWDGLVNLNYNNPEVQQWIIEACKYWLNKYDIDGYRFDAVWGLNARTPSFSKRLREELKAIKPDFMLLAEDKASDPNVFKQGFDAAYDWTADTAWVSQWAWQTDHNIRKNLSIFNYTDSLKRVGLLKEQLYADNTNSDKVLRFIENNDVPRFIATHNLEQTKTAAALMFALPGIPMIYNGQEIGSTVHPYSGKAIFSAANGIASGDDKGLFAWYQTLINMRREHPALRSKAIEDVPVINSKSVIAFHKWEGSEHFIVVANMAGNNVEVKLDMERCCSSLPRDKLCFKEVLNKNAFDCIKLNKKDNLVIPINGYQVRWIQVANQ
ncbi:DUF3459 domain-containing protein [Mucilaginibacter conchicola]|uniref:DUF3459 domain-containing protein n=1 Tax=Mucilaginibacter conchicola TaxID=2303333 RepID=A0A372NWF3_9SPHI|nr:alpha-amylase family glycosyl hydrolase [Mucilaginibacter conchicola]RFZ93989.1 DUF3459 domain-containing protein [Mucilaginibacter conchicola]